MAQLEAAPSPEATTTKQKEKKAAEAGRMQLKKAEAAPVAGEMASASLRDADEFQLSVVRTPDAKVFWVISRRGRSVPVRGWRQIEPEAGNWSRN